MKTNTNKSTKNNWDLTISKIVLNHELNAFIHALPGFETITNFMNSVMLWLLINTGVRVSELCSLRVIDTPRYLGANCIEVYKGKRNKSRNIYICQNMVNMLNYYIDRIRPYFVPRRHPKRGPEGFLFYSRGKKVNRQYIDQLIKRVAKNAGITKKLSAHKFRHRFACCALNADGSNIYVVKQMMGHASITTTEKYLHIAGFNKDLGSSLSQFPEWYEDIFED